MCVSGCNHCLPPAANKAVSQCLRTSLHSLPHKIKSGQEQTVSNPRHLSPYSTTTMDEEALRELIRAQQEREALELLQRQQQQQQLPSLQRQDSQQTSMLPQFNQGLGATPAVTAASLLSRARSPVEAPAPAPSTLDQFLAAQRRSSLMASSAQLETNPFASALRTSTTGALGSTVGRDVSALTSTTGGLGSSLGRDLSSLTSPGGSLRGGTSLDLSPFTSTAGALGGSGRDLSSLASTTGATGRDLSSLVLSQEIKRLQGLRQQLTPNPTSVSNPFLYSPQSARRSSLSLGGNDPNSSLLQQYLLQKAQLPTLSQTTSALGASLTSNASLPGRTAINESPNQSILGSQLLREARMLLRPETVAEPTTFAAAASAKAPAPFPRVPTSPPAYDGTRKMRGGVIEPFPEKLHRLLLEVELTGRSDVISFVNEGRAFAIHKSEEFFRDIVPLYFKQSRLSSFKRQLNLYGFELINTGPSRGAYFHRLFVRDKPQLCRRMRRVAVKVSAAKPSASAAHPDKEGSSSSEDEGDRKMPSSIQPTAPEASGQATA